MWLYSYAAINSLPYSGKVGGGKFSESSVISQTKPSKLILTITVDVKRFAGLNIRDFSPMKFLQKYFRGTLATSVYYLPIAKNSREKFGGTLKNRESLAQRIVPHLR